MPFEPPLANITAKQFLFFHHNVICENLFFSKADLISMMRLFFFIFFLKNLNLPNISLWGTANIKTSKKLSFKLLISLFSKKIF